VDPRAESRLLVNRREFFGRSACGLGTAAVAYLLARDGTAAGASATAPTHRRFGGLSGLPNFPAKAKHVIYLFQNGAPTHVDLFDHKPHLTAMHGKPVPQSYLGNKRFSTMTGQAKGKLMLGPISRFKQHGRSGAWVSDLMPHVASVADDICFIKGMHTEAVNHAPAITFFLTGSQLPGRPTMGAWLSYGLGSETDNLPAFVVMTSVSKGTTCGQIFYDFYWDSGFLPSRYQGVKFRGSSDPVLYLDNPAGISAHLRRGQLDDIAKLNAIKQRDFGDPEIGTRIAQYEMAYRMQTSVPGLTDISKEPPAVLALYGPDAKQPGTFAYNCLVARRLIERGVRFVQVMHAGWDQHNSITTELYTTSAVTRTSPRPA
jgi:hypothetical protein